MKNLKIDVYNSGQDKPEKEIVIPLVSLHTGLRFLPKGIRQSLDKEGIDLSGCTDLVKEKDLKGSLIEIGNPKGKTVISLD